jgi:hypothetical protein
MATSPPPRRRGATLLRSGPLSGLVSAAPETVMHTARQSNVSVRSSSASGFATWSIRRTRYARSPRWHIGSAKGLLHSIPSHTLAFAARFRSNSTRMTSPNFTALRSQSGGTQPAESALNSVI